MSAIFSRSGTETLMNRRVTKKSSPSIFFLFGAKQNTGFILKRHLPVYSLIVSFFFIFKNRIEKYPKCIFIRPDLNKDLRKIQIMVCITFFSIDAD